MTAADGLPFLKVVKRPDGWWITGFPGGERSDAGPYESPAKADKARELLRPLFATAYREERAVKSSKRDAARADAVTADVPRRVDFVGQRELF